MNLVIEARRDLITAPSSCTLSATLSAERGTTKVNREALQNLPIPATTKTYQPISHYELVGQLIESLSFRQLSVVRDEYAVSRDGYRMFGLLVLDHEFSGCRFAIGLRNSNDKSMRLAMTAGFQVMVCTNMAFKGDFQPLLAKHSRSLNLVEVLAVGLEKIQRNFEPLKRTIEDWRCCTLEDSYVKCLLYEAFVERRLAVPNLIKEVHRQYFQPAYEEFQPRTLWSLSNAFTSAFKKLKPMQQFQATAKLSPFLNRYYLPY